MNDVSILRRLGKRNVSLARDGSMQLPAQGDGLPLTVAAEEVERLLSDDLIAIDRGRVTRTSAGDHHLRRALSQMPEDRFADQHRDIVWRTSAPDHEALRTNAAESPLAWLATRRDKSGQPMISATQLDAGMRLARDHERAMMRERVTQSWDASGVRGGGGGERLTVTEAAHDARERVRAALDRVGPELSSVLYSVCCAQEGLESVEKRHGWPARCGKVVLRLALDRLAQHYGIAPAVSGAARAGLVHWGSSDYRPSA